MLTTGKYKREHERFEVNLPLILETGNSRIIARSKNLSAGGASISLVDFVESQDLDDQGSITIRSQAGDIQTPYEITYRQENVIGIRFSRATHTQIESLNHIFEAFPAGPVRPVPVSDSFVKAKNKSPVALKRRLWVAARMAVFLTVNLLWPLLKYVVKPKVVFARVWYKRRSTSLFS